MWVELHALWELLLFFVIWVWVFLELGGQVHMLSGVPGGEYYVLQKPELQCNVSFPHASTAIHSLESKVSEPALPGANGSGGKG